MTVTEQDILDWVRSFNLVSGCDKLESGMLRLETPFQHLDGSRIDLFVDMDLSQEVKLTDMGDTYAYLLDLHVKPWSSKRREKMVDDICDSLGVQRTQAELFVRVPPGDTAAFNESLVRLAQACLRISDLAMTQQSRTMSAFRDEVEEFVASIEIPYEAGVQLPGRFGKPVEVDFQAQGRTARSLVLTLSTKNAVAAHGLSNEAFRKWYDLADHAEAFAFVTAYDSTTDVFREEDVRRLEDVSTAFAYPAQSDDMAALLEA